MSSNASVISRLIQPGGDIISDDQSVAVSSDRYTSKVISENTVLDSNTQYFTGTGTVINTDAVLTIPVNSILEIKKFGTGKPL